MQIVLYHRNCVDGIAAAGVLFNHFRDSNSVKLAEIGPGFFMDNTDPEKKVVFWPVQYGDELSTVFSIIVSSVLDPESAGFEIHIVDFSFPAKMILDFIENQTIKSITIIDHHASAREALTHLTHPKLTLVFNMDHSGAVLTWLFYAQGEIPGPLLYVEDRDLWLWKMGSSRAVSASFALFPKRPDVWGALIATSSIPMGKFITEGETLLLYEKGIIDAAVLRARKVIVNILEPQFTIVAVNSPVLQSEIGEALLKQFPDELVVGIYFHDLESNNFIWSLRGRNNDGLTARSCAERFGGGGHPRAAGFRMSSAPLSCSDKLQLSYCNKDYDRDNR